MIKGIVFAAGGGYLMADVCEKVVFIIGQCELLVKTASAIF